MTSLGESRQRYDTHWEELESYFDHLPSQLYRQGRLLRNNIAIHYSHSGKLSDILLRTGDYPQLRLQDWLLDDFGFPAGERRSEIERRLFLAIIYQFFTIYIQESILDDDSFFDNTYLHLMRDLSSQEERQFSFLFNADSLFWDYYHRFWHEHTQVALFGLGDTAEAALKVTVEDLYQGVGILAPYKLIPISTLILAGRDADLPGLLNLMDALHIAINIYQDVANLHVDLLRGKHTYPVLALMAQLGIPFNQKYNPEGALAAMAIMGLFDKYHAEFEDWIRCAKQEANNLELRSILVYLDLLDSGAKRLFEGFNSARSESPDSGQGMWRSVEIETQINPPRNSLKLALQMAEGYLLTDLTFKESWEVHRRGLVGAREVTARFPAGFILEILCKEGHSLSVEVDAFFHSLQKQEFSYYDHPKLLDADSDTLGLLLRLYPYASDKDSYREGLAMPLGWMKASVGESGRIPVWMSKPIDQENAELPDIRLIGEGCGSIEASLLVGLINYEWAQYQEIILRSAERLIRSFIEQGPTITVNYPRLFCLWKVSELLETLRDKSLSEGLSTEIIRAVDSYPDFLESEISQYRITPQTTAFLTLACLNTPAENCFDQKWITTILKNQRPDGSWYGEPLFFVPNRGELTTWHTSHLLTSAFCYHALRKFENWMEKH